MLRFISVTLLLLLVVQQSTGREPLVKTDLGSIRGSVLKTLNGRDIFAYRGIRYAQAPTGERRFAAPVPVEAWNDILDATEDSALCPQPVASVAMSEDCLKLNVYTSSEIVGGWPVLVYIHGGSNKIGSGHSVYEAGPQYLLDAKVILVTFNYRLGALGFLSTRSAEVPGNFGYLDQVLALQWVQAHIRNFGGNPNRVTIFGMSAGSMAVTLHMASPLSANLFHRAIAMSGSATNEYIIDNQHWTRKLAEEVGCPKYNAQDLLDCLRAVSWQKIIDVCATWEHYGFINMKWNYEIDGKFLLEHPTETFRHNRTNNVPLMTGITLDELDFHVFHQENNTGLLNDISQNFASYAPELFLYKNWSAGIDSDETVWRGEKLKEFYIGNSTNITQRNLIWFGRIFSDAIIGHGVYNLVRLASRNMDVFYYRFDYVSNPSLRPDHNGNAYGVVHADDLKYIMPSTWYGTQFPIQSRNIFMVERMVHIFETFATWGYFSPSITVNWPKVDPDDIRTFYNNDIMRVGSAPNPKRYALWDELFAQETSGASQLQLSVFLATLIAGVLTLFL
ncbi:juvenile hormone esterase [Zeugodacus cucurbitae]|uniref:juvenile hormone esterase n=1 Tax=Zeugodacus cucurbitae TaxID=28588 RepID=UPI000596900A|nr:juvenile hormone esterase [Zeugodacus cucurbitae]